MASNDNIDLTIRAKLDDKASKDLKNLSGSIDKIKGEVTTTAKADTGAAENKVKTYKDKLDSIQKSVSTKVFANTKSAHASIENLKRKLDAFDKKNYDVKVSVKADGDIKEISSLSRALQTLEKRTKDFSINVDMGSTEKVAKNLENVVDRIKAIDKNAHISFSSEGFNDLSSELKEIYGLLKGINKYKDVNVSGRANISRQRATSTAVEKEEDGFKSYQQQLSSIAIRGQKAHQNGDIEQLHALGNEYAFVSKEMQDYVAKMGMVDYNGQAKMMTPVIQRLQEYGVIAKDNYGILDKLKASQREFDNNLVAKADFTTASEKVRANRGLAEQALNNGDTAGYQAHLAEAEKYKAIQQKITDEMKHQVDLEIAKGRSADEVNATLNQRIKALQTIAQDSYSRGMTNDAKEIGTQIMELKQKKLELEAMQAKSPYERQRKEAQVISAKLGVAIDKGAEARVINDLRTQLMNKTMEATKTGIDSGAIAATTAISRYNAMIPIALKLKDDAALKELQNRIQALGGTPINLRVNDNGAQQQIKTLGQVYKELQVQAVQAAERLNTAFKNNSGIDEAKRNLTDVLNKIKEIKQANGDFTYGGQADLLKRLATRYKPTSDTYAELTTRAEKSRVKQREINSDSGDSRRGGFTVAGAGAYIIRFIGRSSKGWGSFGEAMSQAIVDLNKLSGSSNFVVRAFGKLATPLGVLMGVVTVGVGVFQSALQMLQTFGNMLLQIGNLVYNALKPGIELYKNMVSSQYSFTAALMSNGYDSNGNHLNRNDASGISSELITKAQFDAEMSAFNFDEILRSLQGTLPVLLAKGMSLAQAYEVNKGVAGVAKLIQLTPSQILQETRDLAQGSITAKGSQVAGALGVTNQDLAGKSADEIFDFLMQKFKNFTSVLNDFEDTAYGRAQQLEDRLKLVSSKFVDSLASGFKGLFESIIEWTGSWKGTGKDSNGNQVSATYDAIKQVWTNDENGEVLDKLDEDGNVIQHWQPSEEWFQWNDILQEAEEALEEIVMYIAQAVDNTMAFVEEATGISDPVELAKDIIEVIVQLLEFSAGVIVYMVKLFEDMEQPILVVVNILRSVFNLAMSILSVFTSICDTIEGAIALIHSFVTGDTSYYKSAYNNAMKGYSATGDVLSNFANATPWRSYKDAFGTFTSNSGEDGFFTSALKKYGFGVKQDNGKSKIGFGGAKGNPNPVDKDADKKAQKAQREADKARREAIKESQRMLKERQQELKEILDDKLQELKDALKRNEIAYKEGFKSITEYFTEKAELEKQEAQARLEEAQQEREAIANSKFDSEYQKLAAIHKVNRAIRKYTRELSNATKAQQGVANILTKYRNTILNSNLFGTLNRVNSGTNSITNSNISTNLTQEEADEKSRGDASVKVLERSAGDYGYVVDEIVNQILSNKDYTIPPILAVALARQESGFDNSAISPVGAIGIGQLMPDTAKSLGVNPYDWKQNITGMLKYLQMLWDKFNGDLDKVLAAYNAGPQAVVEYGGIPPYRETINYVDSIKGFMNEYYGNGYNIKSNELLRKANEKLWLATQQNTQAVQSNIKTINGITVDTRDLGHLVMSQADTPNWAGTSQSTKNFANALANAWHIIHPELDDLKVSSGYREGDTGHHGYGEAFDVVNDYFDNENLRREYVDLINKLGGKGLSEWTAAERAAAGVTWASGSNIHATTPQANYGNGGIFAISTPTTLNRLQQSVADTTDLEQQMREALNKFIEEYNSVVEEIRSNIFYEMPDPKFKFRETYKKLEDAKKIAKNNPDAIALVEKYEMLINQQITKLVTEFYENALEVNLQTVQDTGEKIANKLATGSVDSKQLKEYYKKYWGYFYGDGKDVLQMKKRLEDLKAKQKEIENKYNSDTSNSKYIKELEDSFQHSNDALWLATENKKPAEEIEKLTREVEANRAKMLAGYAKRDKLSRPYQEEINKLDQETKLAMQTPLNQIVQLEKQFIKYQKAGNVSAAVEIRKRLDSARQALYGIFDSWIKAIESKYEFESNYFDQMPVTNLQKEQGNQLLSAYKNRELAGANQNKLDALNREYMKRLEMIDVYEAEADELEKVQKKSRRGTKEYNERTDKLQELRDKIQALKFPLSDLYRQIGDTTQIIRLEKELAKIPTLLQNIGKVAKQSLEDNLVNFMTEGINTATSFKQAFGEMLMSILKDIQTFLAKETARDLMTALFGHYHSEGISAGDSKGALYLKASAKSLKEIQTGDANKKQQLEVLANGEGIIGGNLVTIDTVDVPTKKIQTKPQYFGSDWYEKNNGLGKYSFKLDKPWEKRQVKSEVALDAESTKKLLYETRDKSKQIEQKIDVDKLGTDTQAVLDRLNGINTTLQTIDSHITGKPVENKQVQENTEQLKETAKVQEETSKANVETVEKAQEQSAQEVAQETASNTTTQAQISSATVSVDSAKVATENATNAINSNTEQKEAETNTNTVGTTSAGNIGTASQNIGTTLGNSFANMMQPITNAVSSFTNNITGFLNNGAFSSLLSSFDGLAGSAGAQLGGSVFAVSSLMKGDKKEKLLSMIYIELQLIYNALISKASGFATGGYISGIGTSTSDSIPAMLSNGEYVVKASSVRKYGTNFLNAVNDGSFSRIPNLINVPKFADGGEVAAQETARGMSTFASTLGTNVSSTTNMNVALVSNQEEAIAHFMRSPRGQRIMLDFTRGSAKFTNKIVGSY